jgi:hypothetical protein
MQDSLILSGDLLEARVGIEPAMGTEPIAFVVFRCLQNDQNAYLNQTRRQNYDTAFCSPSLDPPAWVPFPPETAL